jgi:hypothetical protein
MMRDMLNDLWSVSGMSKTKQNNYLKTIERKKFFSRVSVRVPLIGPQQEPDTGKTRLRAWQTRLMRSIRPEGKNDRQTDRNFYRNHFDYRNPYYSLSLKCFLSHKKICTVLNLLPSFPSKGWSYLDATYFCFITLATVGFGDIIAGEAQDLF